MNTMSMQAPYGSQESEIDVAGLLHEVWGYKWMLFAMMVIGIMLGAFFAMRQPVEYRSETLIQVDSSHQQGAAAQFLGRYSGDTAATQITLIQSRFILEPVVEALGLNIVARQRFTSLLERTFPWLYKKNLHVLKFQVPPNAINHSFQLIVEQPNKIALYDEKKQLILEGKIGALLADKAQTMQLKVEASELPIGTRFSIMKRPDSIAANVLANKLGIEESGAGKQGTGILKLSLVGTQRTEIPKILDLITETTRRKDAQKKAEEAAQTLNFLEHQLPIARQLLAQAEKAFNSYRAKSGKIDLKFQTSQLLSQLSTLDTKLNELQLKELEMKQQYTKVHPVWVSFKNQVDALQKQRMMLEASLKKLPASDQIATNLMRDVEVKQALYMLLLNKIQELQVVKAGTISGVRVLAQATTPYAPLPSKTGFFLVVGGLSGIMLGILFILIRKFLSPLVEDPQWTERNLSLPNVAIVPYCKLQTQGALTGGRGKLPLLAYTHPKNLVIEALRSLRTTLQVALPCADNNVISILGIAPGVGKTFISANLAYLLAAAGKRVLLIDTDLRKGTMHKYFNLKPAPGLADVLAKESDFESTLQQCVFQENLTLLPRGHYPKNPAELLMKPYFKEMVQACSKKYDIVLFDTPPILLVTDAVLTASLSATNFLAMGASVHQPSDVELAYKRLKNADISINGSIFNFHKDKLRGRYYGKYYNYIYYYDDNEEKKLRKVGK